MAGATPPAPALVPEGGMFWDGRANTLQMQASGPMLDPVEMANASEAEVATKLAHATYRDRFKPLFGPAILDHRTIPSSETATAGRRTIYRSVRFGAAGFGPRLRDLSEIHAYHQVRFV